MTINTTQRETLERIYSNGGRMKINGTVRLAFPQRVVKPSTADVLYRKGLINIQHGSFASFAILTPLGLEIIGKGV